MDVRDAVEADADALAALADSPVDVMRNLVHDRTVCVAVDQDARDDTTDEPPSGATSDADGAPIVGFVSFDARDETIHVTQIAGSESTCSRLLEEPIGFARREGMTVELLVPEGDTAVKEAVEDAAFVTSGTGPQFSGRSTTRYRLDPESDAA
jgi:hypothetical protein